ncbi:uncharacterized protein F5147DRAFT_573666 [Suillus discolor]|uniref:F-box domain-containing protein n=1 Tax=Suillus discolor TaxID=1912936 RepID=A0A9P7FBV6_9AGAM|nr:uncharacterized protein F5147DRAFT_573666 [Suillus discolor]KAG2111320.1 hypothetical protein F5147DRAFT_573666 [Suillus discolor]
MHACLLIPEIVKLIFANVHVYGTDGFSVVHFIDLYSKLATRRYVAGRHSLAALSRVCRSFKDIALDALWVKLDSLEPLFACLPRDLWTMTDDRKLLIQRPVTEADWSVFEQYASRVRILGNADFDLFGGIDAEFVYAMIGFCSQSLLVPNLRILCCKGYRYPDSFPFVYALPPGSQPHSSVCVIEFVGPHSMCPRVGELALCGLTHLRKATLIFPSREDLSWLSRIVGLQELRIVLAGILPPLRSQFRTSYLEKLVIHSFNLTTSGSSVAGWVVPCRQLQLIPTFTESAVAVERVLRMLDQRLLFDVLEHILIDVVFEPNHIDKAFTLQTFTPLMRFSSLKEVDLSTFCMSLLDDDDLGSIVKSWPRLECLYLGTKCFWQTPPKITFRGLVTLLATCPDLRNLGLVFDTTKVASPTAERLGHGVCNTNITHFHVGCSPIEQPLEVAVLLSVVLPCLGEFLVESWLVKPGGESGPDRQARNAKWGEVLEHISHTLIKQESNATVKTRDVTS